MFFQSRALSQIQFASVLTENTNDNLTFYSDEMSKHWHSYNTVDIKKWGDILVVGLRQVSGVSAQSQLELLFKKILVEI